MVVTASGAVCAKPLPNGRCSLILVACPLRQRAWLKTGLSVAKVLVIDDHADIAPTLAALIVHMGHEARFAASCEEALEIVLDFRPEIAFIDLAMPGINGFECARRLLDQLGQQVRLFAMSGYPPNAWPEAPHLFEKYLLKPVLSATVKELIGEEG